MYVVIITLHSYFSVIFKLSYRHIITHKQLLGIHLYFMTNKNIEIIHLQYLLGSSIIFSTLNITTATAAIELL